MNLIINNFIKKNFPIVYSKQIIMVHCLLFVISKHNNNVPKFVAFAIMLILYSSLVMAGSTDVVSDESFVSLTIVNRAPVITKLYFNPEIAFKDDKLECIVAVNDENPDETILIYKWYLNNELVETSNYYLTGFNENDLVTCQITPIDNENVVGEMKSVSITINERPTLSAITGFITKNYKINSLDHNINSLPSTLLLSVLLFIFFSITVININLILERSTKN